MIKFNLYIIFFINLITQLCSILIYSFLNIDMLFNFDVNNRHNIIYNLIDEIINYSCMDFLFDLFFGLIITLIISLFYRMYSLINTGRYNGIKFDIDSDEDEDT